MLKVNFLYRWRVVINAVALRTWALTSSVPNGSGGGGNDNYCDCFPSDPIFRSMLNRFYSLFGVIPLSRANKRLRI